MDTVRRLAPQDTVATVPGALVGKLIGLAIVSIVPALFWTSILALTGPLLGIAFTTPTLFFVGLTIALFLSLIFSALALSTSARSRD